MKKIRKNNLIKINNILNIRHIISIRFSDTKGNNYKQYKDTACTAMARSLKLKKEVYIDREDGQLCAGANHFLGIKKSSLKEICDVYVKGEQVFCNNKICSSFICNLPKYSDKAKKKYILFTPLEKEEKNPDIILMLVNPAQVGRILGLSVYKKMQYPTLVPAGPACLSIFEPLTSNKIHLNFIDYFDRYYQCRQDDELFFKDEEMIISLPYSLFIDIIENIHLSPYGDFKAKIKPQKISRFI